MRIMILFILGLTFVQNANAQMVLIGESRSEVRDDMLNYFPDYKFIREDEEVLQYVDDGELLTFFFDEKDIAFSLFYTYNLEDFKLILDLVTSIPGIYPITEEFVWFLPMDDLKRTFSLAVALEENYFSLEIFEEDYVEEE